MLNIFLCENNPVLLNKYSEIINNYCLMHDSIKLLLASTQPNELLNFLKKNIDSLQKGVYFLDIHFPNAIHDGIYYGLKIKELDSQGKIIFITSHSELSYLALERHVEPFDFIIKDLGVDEIQRKIFKDISIIMDDYINNNKNDHFIRYEIDNYIKNVPLSNILYIETSSQPHKLIIHTEDYSEEFYGRLASFVDEKVGLIKVHRSYVINIHKLVSLDTGHKEVLLENNERIPLSYKYKKVLKSMFGNLK